MRARLALETFENRIVPAAVVRFTEVDSDVITVRTSKGTVADLEDALGFTNGAVNVEAFTVDLVRTPELRATFAGTDVVIAGRRGGGVNAGGRAEAATVNAYDGPGTGIDLGKVVVDGRLVELDAGDADRSTPAVRKVVATFWGPEISFDPVPALSSSFHGDIGSVKVTGQFNGFIRSVDDAGEANFDTFEGTIIGSFKARQMWARGGEDQCRIQVRFLRELVTDAFIGDSVPDAGLVECVGIDRLRIGHLSAEARIDLVPERT